MQNKIKVLLSYIVYPMAIATYFKKALEHRKDVDLKVCGPYSGAWIPWNGGMELPRKYAITPDIPLPFPPNIGEFNYEIVHAQLGEWKPDLIIQIDAGMHFKYKPISGMTVTIGTDPHVLNDWYDTPRKYSDKFFNMQECYSKKDDIYLPYAFSSYDHFMEPETPKEFDVSLIGLQYNHRLTLINKLRSLGISVFAENGPVFDEARKIYNRSRIGLNWSSLDDLNARAFELPAMGLYSVMNVVPDIHKFGFTKFCGTFLTLDEAVEEVLWAINHPAQANLDAAQAHEAVQMHTYDTRIEQVLAECGFV